MTSEVMVADRRGGQIGERDRRSRSLIYSPKFELNQRSHS
jgi:hypothetical protein